MNELAELFTELLLRFATVLPVMLAPPVLVLLMPVTCCPALDEDEVAALRLLAVVVLPTVLLLIVFAPAVTLMPVSEAETLVVVPFAVMEPMVLLEIATVPLLDETMPKVGPPPEVVTEMEPVPVPLPMVLPVTVPMLTFPADT
jgi:hypothetical protein